VENEGIAILEAAACGKPLVLRNSECFTGRFEHGSNCLKGETPDEFASHLRRLAEDPDEYTRLADGARLYAESHSLEQVGHQLQTIYQQLTN